MNDIDKILRSKLYSYQVRPDKGDQIWNSISKEVSAASNKKYIYINSRKRILAMVSACAAIAVAFYFILTPILDKPYSDEFNEPVIQPIGNRQSKIAALTDAKTIIETSCETNHANAPLLGDENMADIGVYYEDVYDKLFVDDTIESYAPLFVQLRNISQKNVAVVNIKDNLWDDDYLFLEEDNHNKNMKDIALGLNSNFMHGKMAGMENMNNLSMLSGANGNVPNIAMERVSDVKYSLPINLGLQLQFDITNFLSVSTGVSYTYSKSKYEALVNKKMAYVKQHMHYLGVPVNFYGKLIEKKGFLFYANAGAQMDKLLRTSYNLRYYDANDSFNYTEKGLEWSVNFGIGLEYRFVDFAGIYLEPNAVYFINPKTPNSLRKDQPFQLKAEIGFRFHL